MEVHYLDTSAVVKLVRSEAESGALAAWLDGRHWVISDLHRTELRRAAARAGPATSARADRLLAEAAILSVHGGVFDDAGRLTPIDLRSLDALHLAVASTLGPDLAGLVAYDRRLLEAAETQGITTWSPS